MSNTDGSDLVQDITKLALSDNFYTWFTTTNQIIDAINPLNIYDITPRKGLSETRSGGNVILDVETGKGLKAYPNDAIGALTLDIENLTSESSVSNLDYFVIEKPGTEPSNDLFKVLASNILPPTLSGNHQFTGTITVNALNVKDNALRLQYDDATTDNDSGLILDTTSSSKVKFTYNTTKSAWFSNRNIGLQDGYAFLTNGTGRRAEFKYTTSGSTQYDVALEMFMGVDSTNNDDKSWIIEARNVDRALNFIYKNYTNTDTETRVFYATVETTNPVTSTFVVTDKIQIGNVAGSTTNFKSVTDYSSSIIPISNSNGILDSKWTNRYVSSTYSSGLAVGDIVKIYNDTNNQATVVKCALTSVSDDSEAYSLGIVERISGGKVWVVTHGEFSNVTGLDPGAVYYLTSGTPSTPNYTLTKPTTGIVKPVFVATSSTTGVIFPMSSQGLSFGRFNATASGGTLVSGATVSSVAPNDIFTLVAGSGISLETTGSKSIIIRAAVTGSQPTYSSISTNSGTVNAYRPSETLSLIGSGGVVVTATDIASTNGDQITIRGKYFRTISWSGDSSTNDIPGSYTAASYDDTFNIYAGVGIGISAHPSGTGNGFRIDATGSAISSIAVNSQDLNILKVSAGDSILGYFGGSTSSAVTKLSPTANSILGSTSASRIEWQSVSIHMQQKLAATEATSYVGDGNSASTTHFGITTTSNANNRMFGLVAIPRNSTSVNGLLPTDIAAFRFNSLNNINGGLLGLVEGDGIELKTQNNTSNLISNIPSIKITNKYGPAFNRVTILDTSETISADATQTKLVKNYATFSDNFGANVNPDQIFPIDETGSSGSALYGWHAFSSTKANKTSITLPNGSTGSVCELSPTGSSRGGMYHSLPKELYATNKTITFSVYARTSTTVGSLPTKFKLYFYDSTTGSPKGTVWTSSEEFTTDSTWRRYSVTFTTASSYLNWDGSSSRTSGPVNDYLNEPGEWYIATGGKKYSSFAGQHVTIQLVSGQATTNIIELYGGQIEEGSIATDYVSNGVFNASTNIGYVLTAGPGGTHSGGALFNTANRWSYNFASAYNKLPEGHGDLKFSTAGSPILLDSDTNSDTIYFNIATNSITNSYLATMADNTVKVGTGSTNADNTPQDLAIGTNSVLGRVGNGDLRSVNMTQLATMLGSTQFQVVRTDDGGTLLPSESTTIRLRGGSGITTSTGTNNEIIITSTGAPGGGSIGQVGSWNGSSSPSSQTGTFTKLLFQNSSELDLNSFLTHTITTNGSDGAIINSKINWEGISGQITGGGPGLLFANGVKSASSSSLSLTFTQVGNNNDGDFLPFLRIPSSGSSSLIYLRNVTGGTESIQRVVGFKSDGTLVATSNFTSTLSLSFTNISNLTFSGTTITASTTAATTFPIIASNGGVYTNGSENIGISMPTSSSSLHLGRSTALGSTWSSGDFITQLGLGGSGFAVTSGVTAPSSSTIKTRFFGSSAWANLSAASSPRICMPDFLIGTGPDSNTDSNGSGFYLRNDTTNNGLIFTNYNFTASGSTRTIRKDRSTRIGLEVLTVPATGTSDTAYGSSVNTAYLTHTFIPKIASGTTVDEFLIPNNSKKSYKYFIHVENASGDFYTTELLIQVKGTTTNIVQYASSSTSTSLSVNFSISATAGASDTTVTLTHNKTSGSLDIKLLKYEV
jgi:hypothetical protein